MPLLKIATRKSPLALAQANEVRAMLLARAPELEISLLEIVTSGDKFVDRPLADIGGKGLFTKEIEEALLAGDADIAVHSMKDLPTVLPEGLIIGCMPEREDPRDVLICHNARSLAELPQGATFGTSSLRRASQVLVKRPDIHIVPLRGNVQTRLKKLEEGTMQATMLASAGLNRLHIKNIPGTILETTDFLPAVAQGIIGVECREGDSKTRELLAGLSHAPTQSAGACERAFLRVLDGSCRTPIAGYARIENNEIHFSGLIAAPDGSWHHSVQMQGAIADAAKLGEEAGKKLKAQRG